MAKINLAQQLATTLEQAGIKRIWGLTGDSLNGLTDALRTMEEHRPRPIVLLPVVDASGRAVGMIHMHMLVQAGLTGGRDDA